MFHAASEFDSPQFVLHGKFPGTGGINVMLSPRPSGAQPTATKEIPSKVLQEQPGVANGTGHNRTDASVSGSAPASK